NATATSESSTARRGGEGDGETRGGETRGRGGGRRGEGGRGEGEKGTRGTRRGGGMKIKLGIVVFYAGLIGGPAGGAAAETPSQRDCNPTGACDDAAAQVKKLDLNGQRGTVCFRHKTHENYSNPDPLFAHQPGEAASCTGCHHKRSDSTGVPLLAKCTVCHRIE